MAERNWKLNEHEEAASQRACDMFSAAMVAGYKIASYKGVLDGREVIIMAVLMPNGSTKPFALAMTDELFNELEVERADDSVRKGV
jgi:hypothetical protein